jgi:hypothetical protein
MLIQVFSLVNLLLFYGLFLIVSGIVAVIFIGSKAKTALISGGTAGSISLLLSYVASLGIGLPLYGGICLSLVLFIVFSWRTTKTLFRLFEMFSEGQYEEAKGKGIAFLIIALMAVVSLVVLVLQVVFFNV